MPLRRFQPISRFGQWRETIRFPDPRSGQVTYLATAQIAVALYHVGDDCPRWDYGRAIPADRAVPVLSAVTTSDNNGILRKVLGNSAARFAFPQAMVAGLRPGPHLLIATATIRDQTDELLREPIMVLDGGGVGGTIPGQAPYVPPPAPPSVSAQTVIRTVTGTAPVIVTAADLIVLLSGPASVILPAAMRGGFAVTLKDAGSVAANGAVAITAAGGAKIDGQASLQFVRTDQSAILTFVPGRDWIIT